MLTHPLPRIRLQQPLADRSSDAPLPPAQETDSGSNITLDPGPAHYTLPPLMQQSVGLMLHPAVRELSQWLPLHKGNICFLIVSCPVVA